MGARLVALPRFGTMIDVLVIGGGNSQRTRNLRCMRDAPQDVLVNA